METPAPEIAALDRLMELTVLLGEDMTTSLAALGLTTSRTHLLWVLHHGGPSTQRALADALSVSARNVTGLVDGLEATGFVTREPHPGDRRATLVTLTPRAVEVVAQMVQGQQELASQLCGGLGPGVLEGLVAGLDAVLERLRPLVAGAGS